MNELYRTAEHDDGSESVSQDSEKLVHQFSKEDAVTLLEQSDPVREKLVQQHQETVAYIQTSRANREEFIANKDSLSKGEYNEKLGMLHEEDQRISQLRRSYVQSLVTYRNALSRRVESRESRLSVNIQKIKKNSSLDATQKEKEIQLLKDEIAATKQLLDKFNDLYNTVDEELTILTWKYKSRGYILRNVVFTQDIKDGKREFSDSLKERYANFAKYGESLSPSQKKKNERDRKKRLKKKFKQQEAESQKCGISARNFEKGEAVRKSMLASTPEDKRYEKFKREGEQLSIPDYTNSIGELRSQFAQREKDYPL